MVRSIMSLLRNQLQASQGEAGVKVIKLRAEVRGGTRLGVLLL